MHGDFSRWTHHPQKNYTAVLEQQGRVRIDADANEQEAIDQHLRQTSVRDVVGAVGAPLEGGGFGVKPWTDGHGNPQLTIAAGRLYVDGILCQLDDLVLPIVEFLDKKRVRVAKLPNGDPRLAKGQPAEIFPPAAPPQPRHISHFNFETGVITFDDDIGPLPRGSAASVRIFTTFRTQPDYPLPDRPLLVPPFPGHLLPVRPQPDVNPWTLPDSKETSERTDLVYLDVWQRHVTALEDLGLRDVALGGPDTTTRLQTICQVKVLPGVPGDTACSDPLPDSILRPKPGRLTNRLDEPAPADSPCIVAPGGGFRGLENRLYRVEIHNPGRVADATLRRGRPAGATPATFKWSRDNGAVVYRVASFELTEASQAKTDSLQLEELGRDRTLALKKGDWVELLDDGTELRGEPGLLVQVNDVKESQRRVLFAKDIDVSRFGLARHPKLRRWDGAASEDAAGATSEGIPVAGTEIELEDGIRVQFADGEFRAGDFWFFAVRTATRSIEPLDFAPPQGIQHHYARLAVITWKRKQGGTGFEVERLCDCRPLFPPLTQQIQLVYVGGDGQEAMPGQQLCGPLAVRLTNGGTAVGGASVKFAVFEPPPGYDGKLITSEMSGLEVIAPTDDQGLAQCNWQLGKSLAAVCQHVRATLLDCQGNERPPSLLFQAKLSIASEVANVSRCPVIAGDATVQDALNTLCAKVADEPGIHVRQVILGATNEPLRNDAIVRPDELQEGVLLSTDGEVDPVSVSRATVFISVEVPRQFGDNRSATVAFVPHILAASAIVTHDGIVWLPSSQTIAFLNSLVDQFNEPLLARVTAHGNFIWSRDAAEKAARLYLDGDTFGAPAPDGSRRPDGVPATHLVFPSRDGRRGGDFRMWFWLRRERIVVVPPDVLDFGSVLVEGKGKILPVQITNNGTSAYKATVRVSGNEFALAGGGTEIVVDQDQPRTIPVAFGPRQPGVHTGQLAIVSSNSADPSFTLTLTGIGIVNVIVVDNPIVRFGELTRTSRGSRTITVSNEGDKALIVDAIESDVPGLTADPSSFQVAPGGQQKVTLSLQPRSAGDVSGEVRIVSGTKRRRVTVSAIVRDAG